MHTLLPGHSHRARSEQPDGHRQRRGKRGPESVCRTRDEVPAALTLGHSVLSALILKCVRLTTVVLVAVVIAVHVSVTAFGCQDAAA